MGPTPYIDQDTAYGALLGNLINPPEEPGTPRPAAAAPAPDPRFAVPPGQPPNPVLRMRPPAAAPVAAAQPQPATPSGVTPSGNAGAAPQPKPVPSFYQQGQQGSLDALTRSSQAASSLQSLPDPTTANAPLEQRRTALATPIPYRDPQTGKVLTSATDPVTGQAIDPEKTYSPSTGARIMRGVRGALAGLGRGGVVGMAAGAVSPGMVGQTPYGDPNRAYQTAEQQRGAQIPIIERQEAQNTANYKAESERLKDIGTETRGVATGFGRVASDATAAQNADQRTAYEGQIADLRQQLADQSGVPKTYEQAAIAAQIDPDPKRRAAFAAAAKQIAATEVKKFEYANRATPGGDDQRRQPMIDAATADVNKLNTWEYDPDANSGGGGFYDPSTPSKVYTPAEFTALKNQIATKLDKDLTAKKLRPLGVRFNVKDTTPGAAAQPAATPSAPAQTAPKSAAETQQGQVYNGYKYLGGDRTQQASWQKVGQ